MKSDPILPQDSVRKAPGWEKSWNHEKTAARLAWIEAIRCVYESGLGLLGVTAPERMDLPVAAAPGDEAGDG
jgi:arginyl-tRNA synthetase